MATIEVRSYVLILFIFASAYCIFAEDYVPVVMWQSYNDNDIAENVPALRKWSPDEFSLYVTKKVQQKPFIALFVEQSLSLEDFSWMDNEGHGSFPNLQNVSSNAASREFFASVQDPLFAFRNLGKLGYKWHSLSPGLNEKWLDSIPQDEKSVVVINMDDALGTEDRPDLLQRHDEKVGMYFNKLVNKYGNVFAVYTASHSSWEPSETESVVRVRRSAAGDNTGYGPLYSHGRIMLYSNSALQLQYKMPKEPNSTLVTFEKDAVLISSDEGKGTESLTIKLKDAAGDKIFQMKFTFLLSVYGYWNLDHVSVYLMDENESANLTVVDSFLIEAPLNFSYHCGQKVVFQASYLSMKLIFHGIQVQPFLGPRSVFDDGYDCVYFFTAAIWSGLFITAILALILAWGVVMIMDIRTMDRFDDPKGKTITISATD